jgi:hypothetical protein
VTLSWISEWKEEAAEESLYLLLLKSAGIKQEEVGYPDWKRDGELEEVEELEDLNDPEWPNVEYPPHAVAEYTTCPRRFYYSYFTQAGPIFESDFHHQFLYGSLLAWYMCVWKVKRSKARQFIDPMFPQWTEARKRDLAERWGSFKPYKDSYDGKQYNVVHRNLFIPAFGQAPGARRAFEIEEQHRVLVLTLLGNSQDSHQMASSPGTHCRYCPHNNHCKDAQFPVDDE